MNGNDLPKLLDTLIQIAYTGDKNIIHTPYIKSFVWFITAIFDEIYSFEDKFLFMQLHFFIYDSKENNLFGNSLENIYNNNITRDTFGFVLDKHRHDDYELWPTIGKQKIGWDPKQCELKTINNIKFEVNFEESKLKIEINDIKNTLILPKECSFKELKLGIFLIMQRGSIWNEFDDYCIEYINTESSHSKYKQYLKKTIQDSKSRQEEMEEIENLILSTKKLPKFYITECEEVLDE